MYFCFLLRKYLYTGKSLNYISTPNFFWTLVLPTCKEVNKHGKNAEINPNLNTAQVPFILTEPSDMLAGPLPRPRGNDRAINCWLGGEIRTLWNFVQSVNRSLLPKHLAI